MAAYGDISLVKIQLDIRNYFFFISRIQLLISKLFREKNSIPIASSHTIRVNHIDRKLTVCLTASAIVKGVIFDHIEFNHSLNN